MSTAVSGPLGLGLISRARKPQRRVAPALLGALMLLGALAGTARAQPQRQMTGYIADPTDQLAVPGDLAGAEITPEGDLYTGWAEYELSYGARLRPWYQPTRTLPDPNVPLYVSDLHAGAVGYTEQQFAVSVAGAPVAYVTVTAHNRSDHAQVARVQMAISYTRGPQVKGMHGVTTGRFRYERPVTASADGYFSEPGQVFNPAWSYLGDGRDILRGGLLLARGPQTPATTNVSMPSAVTSASAAQVKQMYSRRLAGGQSASFTWQVPLDPSTGSTEDEALDAVPLTSARAALFSLWRAQDAGLTRIQVPEPRVNAAYEANVMEMLASRYDTPSGWVQASNKLQYQAYWIRDSAIETTALDDVGLHAAAAQNLAFLAHWQQPDGLYISRPGQQDGVGQALWELSEHAQLTQDPQFAAAALPNVAAAVAWIATVSAEDPLGILPPSNPGDGEFALGHVAGDSLWAAMGLREAVTLAALAGRADLASQWQTVDSRFEASLDAALNAAYARTGHISPMLDSSAGYDWGNYWAAYPLPILDPNSPMVTATEQWANAHSQEGLATYANGSTLHDYLGFKIYETELAGGNVAQALDGFYAELAHTTSTGFGWEMGITPWGDRENALNLTPHGTFAGEYVTMLRNLLVSDDGPAVDLASGVSPAWMEPGQRITVQGAPTHHGSLSFTLDSGAGTATLTWTSNVPAGTPLYWKLPYWARSAHTPTGTPVTGALALNAPSGTATIDWSGAPPAQSYAQAVSTLNAGYRAHGKPAPIVPALL